ncbi:hypothetical protein HMPREF9318_00875 [Streptococcus urinalis FB127-CNA-2]|uniref:Membrane protein n=1 Tax=Streptococcus urinalis 2285-97 TaxID=764291 RepID=G5KGD2_9STRE|nr:YoaK family protein [Streptococcus urinalis]EHJ56805.1 putative membrane protein [Streptococcus urinalis 2285-97]EKS20921.1 hypothetical protein HMPREF9318_00875 [Streptococcus urinalis FB127-CNA-2]VEF33133.1 membrane protein [Streptococcus urinalis]
MQLNQRVMPQDGRPMALLLGFIGGFIDVYSEMQFHTLVATQTGNIILMVTNLGQDDFHFLITKLFSVAFFSIGFLIGIMIKERAITAYWRLYALLPLLLSTIAIPFISKVDHNIWVALLALGTGILMLTFSGSRIESEPYTILMTSGNYRKMLQFWYEYIVSRQKTEKQKRRAINYSLVVGAFVVGALVAAELFKFVGYKAILGVTVTLLIIMVHYGIEIVKKDLKMHNI